MIKWLLMTSLAGSIASLLLILPKAKLTAKLGGRWYYGLCLSALLLFVIPLQLNMPSIHKQLFLTEEGGTVALPAGPTGNIEALAAAEVPAQSIPAAGTAEVDHPPFLTIDQWILTIWAAGCLVMIGHYLFSYFRFKRDALQGVHSGNVDSLKVITSPYVRSPMLVGFLRPAILMPDTDVSSGDYQLALRHELIHHKQRDVWFKLFAVIVNCLHWFNPVSYLALGNIGEACEFSVDEQLTREMKGADKKRYSEMILHFASQSASVLNSSLAQPNKQLHRRFALIMKRNTGTGRTVVPGLLLAAIIAAVSIVSSSAVFAETAYPTNPANPSQTPLLEYFGGIKTCYNTSLTLEENVQITLGIKSAVEKATLRLTSGTLYIDDDGKKLDFYNRTEPYYKVDHHWQDKSSIASGLTTTTLSIQGKTLMVAFADKAAAYKEDKTLNKMIINQITYELSYQNPRKTNSYNHQAFINSLIKRGVYVVDEVVTAEHFTYELSQAESGGLIGWKPLTVYDQEEKIKDIFNATVKLPETVDGGNVNQGRQLGQPFIIKGGQALAINIRETTDAMPTINLVITDKTTGQVVYWNAAPLGGTRHIYVPGENGAGHTYKVTASGEVADSARIEIYTYQSGTIATELAK